MLLLLVCAGVDVVAGIDGAVVCVVVVAVCVCCC